jgi:dTDP-glucose pyrophosphorylase
MLIITLAGSSNRFFKAGYKIVKYKLPFKKSTVIENILSYIPPNIKLLIILNKKFDDFEFLNNILIVNNFKNFKIVEINDTLGQLESVFNGLLEAKNFVNNSDSVTIFNGDTIRKLNNWENFDGEGAIETFITEGDHWSFVDKIGDVSVVKEKNRISNYCSTGLYYFKNVMMILDNYENYLSVAMENELYVAPFYNFLIEQNINIKSFLVEKNNFIFCGTPVEYQDSIQNNP